MEASGGNELRSLRQLGIGEGSEGDERRREAIAGPEVESALLAHPAVRECGVVGVAEEERGQIVKAYVVLEAGETGDTAMVAALQAHVKAAIAPYKYPRAIQFCAALPRTETGKLQRFALRQGAGA